MTIDLNPPTEGLSRRGFLERGALVGCAAAGVAGGFEGTINAEAFTTSEATSRLRTAAAIENAGAAVCQAALTSPVLAGGPGAKVVKDAIARLQANHKDQAKLLNGAASTLGGDGQLRSDSHVEQSGRASIDHAKTISDLLSAIAALEQVAMVSLATYASQVSDSGAAKALIAIAPVHARDAAVLLSLAEVSQGGAVRLDIRPVLTAMPEVVGRRGFPDSILSQDSARPPKEAS